MTVSSVELQGAIHALLKADTDVDAMVSGRVYDRIPKGVAFPYISYADVSSNPYDSSCVVAEEFIFTLDVWSRSVGSIEAKEIAGRVKKALHNADLSLVQNAAGQLVFRGQVSQDDPDGLTSHVSLTFKCIIQEK